jgi:ATP-dependent RNA helicase SUPV3L1/SUV3
MPLESNMKLLNSIKENSDIFDWKYFKEDEKFLRSAEKDLIKHINRINSLLADLNFLRKQFEELSHKKKLKAKEFKLKKDLSEHIAFLEGEEDFLIKDRDRTKEILRESSEIVWEIYRKSNNIPYSFEEILNSERNLKFFYNEGIINTYKIRFVPKILSDSIKRVFPTNPKDEFMDARSMERHIYIHEGGTNSGKTYSSIQRLMQAESGLYLAPLRLLALEIFDKLNANGVNCNLKTGEEEIIVEEAKHTSSTVEKVDLDNDYEVVVIDEAQMIADPQRGAAWTRALLGVRAKEIHLCCALHATEILKTIINDCEDIVEVVHHERNTDLIVESDDFDFPPSVKEGDALIVFSRRSVLTIAAALEERGISCSLIYGSLPPETRRMQFEKFLNKETGILVSTDAIGMGVNLPIKRVVFLENEKFDGIEVRDLKSAEVKQIAGRAGRKGIYDEGFVNTLFFDDKKNLKEMLVCNEANIEKALLAPTEDILKVADADLEVKLKVWADIVPEVDFYEKINVDRLIELINIITNMGLKKHLTDKDLFKAINIPFDEKDNEILELWKEYLFTYATKKHEVSKPYCDGEDLFILEIYYRKIDLYYSFCKTFKFDIDETWVKEERSRIAKLIDKYLKERIKRYRKTCKRCGIALPWNYVYPICPQCHSGRFFNKNNRFSRVKDDYDDEDWQVVENEEIDIFYSTK